MKTHFYKLAFRNYYGPQFIFICVYESVSVEMNVSLCACMSDCIYLSLNCETPCNTVFWKALYNYTYIIIIIIINKSYATLYKMQSSLTGGPCGPIGPTSPWSP